MITIDKLRAVKTIIVHADCADGLVSAMLLKDALPGVTFRFLHHETVEHLTLPAEPGMLFADFSPPAARVQEFVDAGALVLDHHRTARAVVEAFGENGVFGDESAEPGVCGATLVYKHVWGPMRASMLPSTSFAEIGFVQKLSTLAGVRDTWQRNDPRWREACIQHHVLMFIPRDRWMKTRLVSIASDWGRYIEQIGEILQEKQDQATRDVIAGAYRFTTLTGTRVVVFEGLRQTSDAAEAIGADADLVVGFGFRVERDGIAQKPKMMLSLRSHTSFDCAAMCKAHGGGGHTRAAGFSVALKIGDPNPYDFVRQLVEAMAERAGDAERERDALRAELARLTAPTEGEPTDRELASLGPGTPRIDIWRAGERAGVAHERARHARSTDAVYRERDILAALAAKLAQRLGYPAWTAEHDLASDPTWEPEWKDIVFFRLPSGQCSWHLKAGEKAECGLDSLPVATESWDGHTTEEKYARILAFLSSPDERARQQPAIAAIAALEAP